ncbi:Low-affinity glucose transporter HXT3 [Durusdinium trenchii]|uniref:Low-affinity glucose transporter HXT3 n=1 Tax=Durusdinium trenchii TaxID=1381693 RepID=A0ABP0RSQ2_9DINO
MQGFRAKQWRKYEAAAESMLEREPTADLALAGFPNWQKAEMQVFLGPIGEYDEVKMVKDDYDTPVCLVWVSRGSIPALLAARLKTSRLISQGLQVVLAREHTQDFGTRSSGTRDYQFRNEERVVLLNLRSQTELNGTPCTILRFDSNSSRWLVRLDSEEEDNELLVSEANLLPLWAERSDEIEEALSPKAETGEGEGSDGDQRGARLEQRELGEGDAEAEEEPEEQSEAEDTNLSRRSIDKADSKGKVKASHAVVVTGFPLWDLERITEYFARFGELRTILGHDKAKNGRRKLLVAYCRKVNARTTQKRVDGTEIDGFKLHAFFPEKAEAKAKARAPKPTISK